MGDVIYPEIGDIWADDDDNYYLFLTKPSWSDGEITVTYLLLNTGVTGWGYFPVNPETSTLYEWYTKVA